MRTAENLYRSQGSELHSSSQQRLVLDGHACHHQRSSHGKRYHKESGIVKEPGDQRRGPGDKQGKQRPQVP